MTDREEIESERRQTADRQKTADSRQSPSSSQSMVSPGLITSLSSH